jgi:3-oxoacyl-[acyl-carrier protein] reductase
VDWNGQVAVVTGGSRGIGAAITRRLAARGAAVGINYVVRATEAEALRADILAAGGRAAMLQADVADPAVAAMFSKVESELGPVSILVNNAGVSAPATLDSYDATALERMRAVNVNGVIHTVRAVMAGIGRAAMVGVSTSRPTRPLALRYREPRSTRRQRLRS